MRLFIAIKFPKNIDNALQCIMKDLRAQGVRGNFSRSENLHLTLAFLGDVKGPRYVTEAMQAVQREPFELTLGETGNFRDIYWIGLKESKELSDYVGSLRNELKSRNIWFDEKPFRPHITLVRRFEQTGPIDINVPEESFTVDKISLMRSERINGKLVYTEIFS